MPGEDKVSPRLGGNPAVSGLTSPANTSGPLSATASTSSTALQSLGTLLSSRLQSLDAQWRAIAEQLPAKEVFEFSVTNEHFAVDGATLQKVPASLLFHLALAQHRSRCASTPIRPQASRGMSHSMSGDSLMRLSGNGVSAAHTLQLGSPTTGGLGSGGRSVGKKSTRLQCTGPQEEVSAAVASQLSTDSAHGGYSKAVVDRRGSIQFDTEGRVVIDADPKSFRCILNGLRGYNVFNQACDSSLADNVEVDMHALLLTQEAVNPFFSILDELKFTPFTGDGTVGLHSHWYVATVGPWISSGVMSIQFLVLSKGNINIGVITESFCASYSTRPDFRETLGCSSLSLDGVLHTNCRGRGHHQEELSVEVGPSQVVGVEVNFPAKTVTWFRCCNSDSNNTTDAAQPNSATTAAPGADCREILCVARLEHDKAKVAVMIPQNGQLALLSGHSDTIYDQTPVFPGRPAATGAAASP